MLRCRFAHTGRHRSGFDVQRRPATEPPELLRDKLRRIAVLPRYREAELQRRAVQRVRLPALLPGPPSEDSRYAGGHFIPLVWAVCWVVIPLVPVPGELRGTLTGR